MLDIEFTIQESKLYMLQCRAGKRTGTAALNMAMDMLKEGVIDEKKAVMRVDPKQLDELLHPICDPCRKKAKGPVKVFPQDPGRCRTYRITAGDAVAWNRKEKVILIRRAIQMWKVACGRHPNSPRYDFRSACGVDGVNVLWCRSASRGCSR
jgi:pyruvate,orthophosphate dikinase